jgi:hypothetical protein
MYVFLPQASKFKHPRRLLIKKKLECIKEQQWHREGMVVRQSALTSVIA